MNQQAKPTKLTGQSRDYVDPPTLPTTIVSKTPGDVDDFNRKLNAWWATLKGQLREIDSELEELRRKV